MNLFLLALIMGLVEGLTEFLPVSSTGHLILANNIFQVGNLESGKFEIIIQIGAILAVVLLYFSRFWGLLFPKRDEHGVKPVFSGFYGLWLLFLTSLPASLLGLIFHSQIKMLFSVKSVLFFLIVGAIFILVIEHLHARKNEDETHKISSIDMLDSKTALFIGFFQILALCPGFSRSASTIMGGLCLKLTRKTAAEYSFLAAVPIIVAASLFDLLSSYKDFNAEDLDFLLIGTLSSFVFALLAIKFFISFVSKFTFKVFAYYRIALAIVLYMYFYM